MIKKDIILINLTDWFRRLHKLRIKLASVGLFLIKTLCIIVFILREIWFVRQFTKNLIIDLYKEGRNQHCIDSELKCSLLNVTAIKNCFNDVVLKKKSPG